MLHCSQEFCAFLSVTDCAYIEVWGGWFFFCGGGVIKKKSKDPLCMCLDQAINKTDLYSNTEIKESDFKKQFK